MSPLAIEGSPSAHTQANMESRTDSVPVRASRQDPVIRRYQADTAAAAALVDVLYDLLTGVATAEDSLNPTAGRINLHSGSPRVRNVS